MEKFILEILKKINLHEEYKKLCIKYNNFDKAANLHRKDVESIIKTHDSDFKYVAKDKNFLKETSYKEFTIRFFIGFKSGIIGFGYLIWKEGENNNFYKGNLHTLSKQIDLEFEEKVQYNSPIATSLIDFEEILTKIFLLFDDFKSHFNQRV